MSCSLTSSQIDSKHFAVSKSLSPLTQGSLVLPAPVFLLRAPPHGQGLAMAAPHPYSTQDYVLPQRVRCGEEREFMFRFPFLEHLSALAFLLAP